MWAEIPTSKELLGYKLGYLPTRAGAVCFIATGEQEARPLSAPGLNHPAELFLSNHTQGQESWA